jgi:hypothetical protein
LCSTPGPRPVGRPHACKQKDCQGHRPERNSSRPTPCRLAHRNESLDCKMQQVAEQGGSNVPAMPRRGVCLMQAADIAKEASRRTAVHRKARTNSCAASRMGRPVPASSSALPPLTKTWPCMPSARGASNGSCAQGLPLSLASASGSCECSLAHQRAHTAAAVKSKKRTLIYSWSSVCTCAASDSAGVAAPCMNPCSLATPAGIHTALQLPASPEQPCAQPAVLGHTWATCPKIIILDCMQSAWLLRHRTVHKELVVY